VNLFYKVTLLSGKYAQRRATFPRWIVAALSVLLLISGTSRSSQAGGYGYHPPYLGQPCVDSNGQPGITPSSVVSGDVFVPPGKDAR
jgi:hypothetical protein